MKKVLPSFTSRPFTGQLGSAAQSNDITLASGKGIKLQDGAFQSYLICDNTMNRLNPMNWAKSAWNNVRAGTLTADTVESATTVDSVDVLTWWKLNV